MRELDLESFIERANDVDLAALSTTDIDHFCSASAWTIAAHKAFHPTAKPLLLAGAEGFVALALDEFASLGRFFAPLECMWGLASPFLGEQSTALVRELAAHLKQRQDWDTLWLSGLTPNSPVFNAVLETFGAQHRLGLGPHTLRHVADISQGLEGWLGQRSPKFRANLRRSIRKAAHEGVSYEWRRNFDTPRDLSQSFDRIVALEEKSWKGLEKAGMESGAMHQFYAHMTALLGAQGRLRILFATQGSTDIAFCFGGVLGQTYRGLQMSFAQEFRALSPGNLVQAEMIRQLSEEGLQSYDLGTEMPYKARWGQEGLETVALVVRRH